MGYGLTTIGVTIANAGTAVPLVSGNTWGRGLIVQASEDNTGRVFVGDSNVDAASGIELSPGKAVQIEIPGAPDYTVDLSTVYVDTETNNNVVKVAFLTRQRT